MDVLVILAGSWSEVSSPREIAGGAPRPTGMTQVGTSSGWPESIEKSSNRCSMVGGPLARRQWRGDPPAGKVLRRNFLVDLGRRILRMPHTRYLLSLLMERPQDHGGGV